MRVVVLGASGFLGGAVIQDLVARGDDVVAVDSKVHGDRWRAHPQVTHALADITKPETLAPVLADADEIYLFAAVLGTSELDSAVRQSVHTNVLGTLNVIEAALAARVPRMFFASKPHVWLNTYTITKHCAEQIGRLYTRYHPIRICALRYLNVFGPGQKLYSVRKILPVFAAQALRGLPLQVYGDGEQTVDMLYSKDAARLTIDYLRTGVVDRTPDCGTGVAMTVNAVAESVNAYFGNRAGIQHVPMRKGETPRTHLVADTRELEEVLGPLQFTDYETALGESLDYYAQLDSHEIDAALSYHGLAQPLSMAWQQNQPAPATVTPMVVHR